MRIAPGERLKLLRSPDVQRKQGGDEIGDHDYEECRYRTRTPLDGQIAALADAGQGVGEKTVPAFIVKLPADRNGNKQGE